MTRGQWIDEVELRQLPRVLVTTPLANTDFPAAGIVGTLTTPRFRAWILHAEWDSDIRILARLLAVLLLNDVEPIIPLVLMPRRAPTVLLLKNGQLRTTRGWQLASWTEDEISRLTELLVAEHRDYLEDVGAALRQEDRGRFAMLPDGEIFETVGIPSVRWGPPPAPIKVRTENSERVRFGLNWYQVAAQDYVRNRYLLLLSETELARRTEDILANMHVLEDEGRVSFDRGDPLLPYWTAKLTEVQVEMHLRHGPYPAGWDQRLIDFSNLPGSISASASLNSAVDLRTGNLLASEALVKYGQVEHLEKALDQGILRISPASQYRDQSLNVAIRDDELAAQIWCDESVPFNLSPPGTVIWPSGRSRIRAEINSNYYVYCLSRRLSSRLLFDFGATACLVIHNAEEFTRRLATGMAAVVEWPQSISEVEYYDPLQVAPTEINVIASKHFRYAYQEEFRVAWVPPNPVRHLQPVEVCLGSLRDIAELVALADSRAA